MSKFYYFAVIITGMMLLLNAGGITTPTASAILNKLNVNMTHNSEDIGGVKTSQLWDNKTDNPLNFGLVQLLGLVAIGGVIVSFFTRTTDINFFLAGIILAISILILTDLTFLAQKLISVNIIWIKWVALTIFIPLTMGFIITVIAFFRGTD